MMRGTTLLVRLSLGVAAAALAFGYQNCGEFAVDAKNFSQFASLGATGSGGAALVPDSDKLDPACLTSSAYDACILLQNPLANSGPVLATDVLARRTQLSSQAIYGVKLTSLVGNGKLENATLRVLSLNSPSVATVQAALKVAPGLAGSSSFEQVNTYYWMNRTAEYFNARSNGALPAKGKGLQVIVDDTITGFEAATNTIRLKSTESGGAIAWNGDVAIHLFGVANLMLANPVGWASLSNTKHQTCAAIDKGCCASFNGCASAIRFGVGEYFASSMFPSRTRIGEGLANNGNPQIIAGISRDVASLTATTGNQIFADANGNAQAMGLLYAAMWWQVRAAAVTTGNSDEVDRIFLEHLTLLDGNDDFRSAFTKAKTVDARLFSGKHSAKFDAQLTARGL